MPASLQSIDSPARVAKTPRGQATYDTAVVGLGYVGLPLCLAFARSGATALGIDTDGSKIDALAAGRSYIKHIAADDIVAATAARRFRATADFREAAEADSVLICVPTPLTANRTPDLTYVANTARSLAPHLRPGQLVVLESTTYPGTTEEIVRPILEQGSGLVNELKLIYSQMGIDVWEVIDAAATKPFGYMPFYPGPGLGGHCIPIDPFYLTWKALEYGQRTRLIELAGEINTAMPEYVVARVIDALNDAGKPVRGSRVLLLGLAYKANVDDDRESPTYAIMHLLEKRGAVVAYNDPHVPVIQAGRSHHDVAGRRSLPINGDHDVMVLCTAHEDYRSFDFTALGVPLVDCRNFATRRPAAYYRA